MLSKTFSGVTVLLGIMLAFFIAMAAVGPAKALADDTPVDSFPGELQIPGELPPADAGAINRLPGSVGAALPDITSSDWTEVPINNVFLMVGGLASLLLLASGLVLIVIGSSTQTGRAIGTDGSKSLTQPISDRDRSNAACSFGGEG